MRKIFLLVLVILICGLNLSAQSSVTKEEYAVYARVLRDIRLEDLKQSKAKYSFVILDKTFNPEHFSVYKSGRFRSLSKDFIRKNLTSSKLENLFPVKYEYEITSKSEIEKILQIGKKELVRIEADIKHNNKPQITWNNNIIWKTFYEKYPNANGYYQFSRVGFSSDKKFAFVSVEGDGEYWSSTMEYILRKSKGKWTIYSSGGGFGIA